MVPGRTLAYLAYARPWLWLLGLRKQNKVILDWLAGLPRQSSHITVPLLRLLRLVCFSVTIYPVDRILNTWAFKLCGGQKEWQGPIPLLPYRRASGLGVAQETLVYPSPRREWPWGDRVQNSLHLGSDPLLCLGRSIVPERSFVSWILALYQWIYLWALLQRLRPIVFSSKKGQEDIWQGTALWLGSLSRAPHNAFVNTFYIYH